MTYNLKKEYFKHYDQPLINEKPIINIYNDDDDQDIYISERSSIASSNDLNQILTPPIDKRSPTPLTSLPITIKQPQTFRYPYNELSESNILVVTQYQHQQKEEKMKTKDLRKMPNGHGNSIPYSEIKSPDHGENYYPYWYYNKGKNPDWIMRHRQTNDGQIIPLDSPDPHQSVLITSPIKPQQPSRKPRNHNVLNQDKQRLDYTENNPNLSSHLPTHEYYETNHPKRRTSPRQHLTLKDSDQDEHRLQPMKRTMPQRRKLKIENDWTESHVPTISNSRPIQDSNGLIMTSNALTNRPKNRSKIPDKNPTNTDMDEISKYRPSHHQIPIQPQNTPSIPSHHPNHIHVRRRPPSGTYLTSDVHVVDVSFKKPDRSSNIQQVRDPFHAPIPTISNQTPRLPVIMRDQHHHHHQSKNHSPRFPMDYYGTLARQTHDKNWDESMNPSRIYKPDPQTRFYDRYLHSIVDKRLAA